MNTPSLLVILSTFPDAVAARAAAQSLVQERLAACVNILPAVESTYRWEGQVESAAEVLAIIKTTPACWPSLQQRLQELHPYQVPEILALPSSAVSASYLHWAVESLQTPP